jgi:FixJ family two-component response regulator
MGTTWEIVEPTVFLVDDDPGARDSLHYLVASAGLKVESFASALSFLLAFDPGRPGCLVLDYRMPEMNGLDLQAELQQRGALLPVIIVSAHGDVAACARAFRAGAIDFLEKPVNGEVLLERIRTGISRDMAQREARLHAPLVEQGMSLLTAREREVMERLVAGKSLKQIAGEFNVSIQTAAKHRVKVLEKFGVSNDIELVKMMLRHEEWRAKAAPQGAG